MDGEAERVEEEWNKHVAENFVGPYGCAGYCVVRRGWV